MVAQHNRELFGSCTNIGECEAVCPKEIKIEVIGRMNRDYLAASWTRRERFTFGGLFTRWSTGSKLQNDNRRSD